MGSCEGDSDSSIVVNTDFAATVGKVVGDFVAIVGKAVGELDGAVDVGDAVEGWSVVGKAVSKSVGSTVVGDVVKDWLVVGITVGEEVGDVVGSTDIGIIVGVEVGEIVGFEVVGDDDDVLLAVGASEGEFEAVDSVFFVKTIPAFHDTASPSAPKIMFSVRPSFGIVIVSCSVPAIGNCK